MPTCFWNIRGCCSPSSHLAELWCFVACRTQWVASFWEQRWPVCLCASSEIPILCLVGVLSDQQVSEWMYIVALVRQWDRIPHFEIWIVLESQVVPVPAIHCLHLYKWALKDCWNLEQRVYFSWIGWGWAWYGAWPCVCVDVCIHSSAPLCY